MSMIETNRETTRLARAIDKAGEKVKKTAQKLENDRAEYEEAIKTWREAVHQASSHHLQPEESEVANGKAMSE